MLQSLRPKQYAKNLFVFAPLFFDFGKVSWHTLALSLTAFVAFSLAASSIYLLNDVMDVEQDRKHPRKKNRPIASGRLSIGAAIVLSVVVASVSLFLAAALAGWITAAVIAFYLALNLGYVFGLKKINLIDVCVISLGFVLRLAAGASSANLGLSHWIVLCVFILSLFLAFAKRRDDVLLLQETGVSMRQSLKGYNIEFVDSVLSMLSSVLLVFYVMYTISSDVVAKYGTHNLYMTTVFVLLGVLRYKQISLVFKNSGAPTEILFKDRIVQASIFLWAVSFVVIRIWF